MTLDQSAGDQPAVDKLDSSLQSQYLQGWYINKASVASGHTILVESLLPVRETLHYFVCRDVKSRD